MTEIVKVEKRRVLEPDQILPSAVEGTYGSIMRHPQKPCNVIEPTEVLPPESPRFTHMDYGISFRTWHPNVFMRRLGYTANPDICRHSHKCYQPRFGWWCKDCGDSLPRG